MSESAILVLHGITMSGGSMLRSLGALGNGLEQLGYKLIAPDGGHTMTHDEATGFVEMISGAYRDRGEDAGTWFVDGKFWDSENHFDWLDTVTNDASGIKTYRAFSASLDSTLSAVVGHDVHGVIGFSQGCVWGAMVTALALRGALPFGSSLKFGIYMSGFFPEFDEPKLDLWPIRGDFHSRFIIGDSDPVFPSARETIEPLAEKFPPEGRDVIIEPGLGHHVTEDPAIHADFIALARRFF